MSESERERERESLIAHEDGGAVGAEEVNHDGEEGDHAPCTPPHPAWNHVPVAHPLPRPAQPLSHPCHVPRGISRVTSLCISQVTPLSYISMSTRQGRGSALDRRGAACQQTVIRSSRSYRIACSLLCIVLGVLPPASRRRAWLHPRKRALDRLAAGRTLLTRCRRRAPTGSSWTGSDGEVAATVTGPWQPVA